MIPERLLTTSEVSTLTGVPRSTLHHWLAHGRVRYVEAGSFRLIDPTEVIEILKLKNTRWQTKTT